MRKSQQLLNKMYDQPTHLSFTADIRTVWEKVLNGVNPNTAVKNCVQFKDSSVFIGSELLDLRKSIHVVGFGKAALGMARGLEDILGKNISQGFLSVPFGSTTELLTARRSDLLPQSACMWEICEGAKFNQPDKFAASSALKISELAKSLNENDILIALISGGGSALLPGPKPPLTFEHKLQITKLLQDQGADIHELNTIRKKLSLVKGGGLARLAAPSSVFSLIISDVIGDPTASMVASGPTFLNNTPTPEQCIKILRKYDIDGKLPTSVMDVITDKNPLQEAIPEPVNVVVCDNESALKAAKEAASELGWHSLVVSSKLCGEAREVGSTLQLLANYCSKLLSKTTMSSEESSQRELLVTKFGRLSVDSLDSAVLENNRICLIFGGETTVRVTGSGRGGRNQELSLSWLLAEHRNPSTAECSLLSCGTDGQDGPTDAAGAVVTSQLAHALSESDIESAYTSLDENDTYSFFSKFLDGKCHVKTGLTGTNVADVQLLFCSADADDSDY